MLQRIDTISTYGTLLAGLIHTGLTPVFKPALDEEALWFAGSGLALIFLSALNIGRRQTGDTAALAHCRAANIAGLLYLLVVARTLRAPHVVLVLMWVAGMTVAAFAAPVSSAEARLTTRP